MRPGRWVRVRGSLSTGWLKSFPVVRWMKVGGVYTGWWKLSPMGEVGEDGRKAVDGTVERLPDSEVGEDERQFIYRFVESMSCDEVGGGG